MWKPIVDTGKRADILRKITEIAEKLYEVPCNRESTGLLTGNAGIALFMYHYGLWCGKEAFYEKALDLLSGCIDFCHENRRMLYSFCNGVAGLGWCLKFFEEHDAVKGNVAEKIDELYPALYPLMIRLMKAGKYDFLHQAVGIALCCHKNEPENRFLKDFLAELHKSSVETEEGIVWYSEHTEKDITYTVINLSMSHGLAGIVSFLCKSYHMAGVQPLLCESVRFLVSRRQDRTVYTSCFPSIISETVNYRNGRLAWCYGDLGVATALWRSSRIVGNIQYEDIALDVLQDCCRRRDVEGEFVRDAGICHGSAGIAHIFNRMYHNTGHEAFREAALYWLDDCLYKARFSDGLAGYKVWRHSGWITQRGLLEGIAGIGLVLLAAVSDIEPAWDECLFLC